MLRRGCRRRRRRRRRRRPICSRRCAWRRRATPRPSLYLPIPPYIALYISQEAKKAREGARSRSKKKKKKGQREGEGAEGEAPPAVLAIEEEEEEEEEEVLTP